MQEARVDRGGTRLHRQESNDCTGGFGAFGARNGQTVAPLVLRMPIVLSLIHI